MTKILPGGSDGQWQKTSAPQKPQTSASAASSPAASVGQTMPVGLTRFIESASSVPVAVYTDAIKHKQENETGSGATQQEGVTTRSLADLPYLAQPDLGRSKQSKKNTQATHSEKNHAQPASHQFKERAPLHRWVGSEIWWLMVGVAVFVLLLMLVVL